MLLQGFNEEIEKSKKNFTDARKYIPIIKALIKSANELAIEGKVLVDVSAETTKTAESVFKEANEAISSSKQVDSKYKHVYVNLSYCVFGHCELKCQPRYNCGSI